MSVKRRGAPLGYKEKLVLEVLEGEKTVTAIASKYEVLPLSPIVPVIQYGYYL